MTALYMSGTETREVKAFEEQIESKYNKGFLAALNEILKTSGQIVDGGYVSGDTLYLGTRGVKVGYCIGEKQTASLIRLKMVFEGPIIINGVSY